MTRFSRRRLAGLSSLAFAGALAIAGLAGSVSMFRAHQRAEMERADAAQRASAQRKLAWEALDAQIQQDLRGFPGEVGFVIEDLSTGWQLTRQPQRQFPAASVIKVAMMAACFQAVDDGELALDEQLPITAGNRVPGSGQLKNQRVGVQVSVDELMRGMIAESDNTAANMLIDRLGMPRFAGYFKQLGLSQTSLSREMMDFKARRRGVENYTTAEDTALLLERAYRRQLISPEWSDHAIALLKQQKLRDRIPARLPPDTLVAHKTGLENHVCHDAGIVYTPQGDVLVCVLTQHRERTARAAKHLIATLSLHVYQFVTADGSH